MWTVNPSRRARRRPARGDGKKSRAGPARGVEQQRRRTRARLATTSASRVERNRDGPAGGGIDEARRADPARREARGVRRAPATSASARPVTPPPHGFSRGCEPSTSATRAPARARRYAAHAPAGPAPTIATSAWVVYRCPWVRRGVACHRSRDTLHGHGRRRRTTIHGRGVSGRRVGEEGPRRARARPGFPAECADDPREGQPRGRRPRSRQRSAARASVSTWPAIGAVVGRGSARSRPFRASAHDLTKLGLSGTMRRVGFQPHDGRIFDALTARGGVLVAIRQRAARGRRAGAPALVRRRERGHWGLDRPRLADCPGTAPFGDSVNRNIPAQRLNKQAQTARHPFCSCLPLEPCARILETGSVPFPMAESTPTAAARVPRSAGHLSVHVEGAHPAEVPFLFEQPAQAAGVRHWRRCAFSRSSFAILLADCEPVSAGHGARHGASARTTRSRASSG